MTGTPAATGATPTDGSRPPGPGPGEPEEAQSSGTRGDPAVAGKVITFYSYKGGTGRTMALANTAWIMASWGRRVLVVDWDLEAPGLHRFFHPFLESARIRTAPGVLDLISDYARAVADLPEGSSWFSADPERRAAWISGHADPSPAVTRLEWSFPEGGRLDYMSAGRQVRYSASFSQFNWDDFYELQNGGEYLDALRERMRRQYDYVLIDSRTGLSDVADICTIQFPDILVDCFTLNDQNIDGAAAVARRVDEIYQGRRVRIMPVAMRVEDTEADRLEAARARVHQRFHRIAQRHPELGPDFRRYLTSVEIPYKSAYAYEEMLSPFRDEPGMPGSLLAACERLTNAITDGDVPEFRPLSEVVRRQHLDQYIRKTTPAPSPVHLSHVPEDRLWAEWIASTLTNAGLDVRRDELELSGRDEGLLLEKLDAADRVVLVVSGAYRDSQQAAVVREWAQGVDPLGTLGTIVPVRVDDTWLGQEFAHPSPVELSGKDEATARELLLRALHVPLQDEEHPAGPRVSGPRYPEKRPTVWGEVPPRNVSFTGRFRVLEQLRDALGRAPVLLHGMGGIGKTQIALEYAYRYRSEYDIVWWIPAERLNVARQKFAELGEAIGLGAAETIDRSVQNVRQALRGGSPSNRWLLVLDNAEDLDKLAPLLVTGGDSHGHIVITARKGESAQAAFPLEVGVFLRQESMDHLDRRVHGIDSDSAGKVAEQLGDLPIALEQAAAWLRNTGFDPQHFPDLLEQRMHSVGDSLGTDELPLALTAVWDLSLKELQERHPLAVRLLELCSLFSAEPIALDLIYGRDMLEALRFHAQDLDESMMLAPAIQELSRYALARVDLRSRALQVHRLIQAVVRNSMREEDRERARVAVSKVLAGARPSQSDVTDPRQWPRYNMIWPHLAVGWHVHSEDLPLRNLTVERVRYLRTRGELDAAERLGKELESTWLPRTGEDDRLTLHLRFELATVQLLKGHYSETLRMAGETLQRQRAVLPENDLHTLMTASTMAAALRGTGRFTEALELDRDTHQRLTEVVGEEHPRTLTAANNFAVSLRTMGRSTESRAVDHDVLQARRRILGEQHPLTLSSQISYGLDLRSCGDYKASLAELEAAYASAVEQTELGSDHPVTRQAAKALAITLRRLGRIDDAELLTQEVLDSTRRQLGDLSPETLVVWTGMVGHLSARRHFSAARDLAQWLFENFQRVLGAEHPNTLAAGVNYSVLLLATGDARDARTLAEEMTRSIESVLGEDHPFVLTSAVDLANAEAATGDIGTAERRYRKALTRLKSGLGAQHPSTLVCAGNLAQLLRRNGPDGEGDDLLTETLTALGAALGPEHERMRRLSDGERIGLELDPHPV